MKNISIHDVPDNAQFIDVREPDEYAEDHARGTTNLPLSELGDRLSAVDTEREVYVICKSGGRSARACEFLEEGLNVTAFNVDGGTDEWREAGLPMEGPHTS